MFQRILIANRGEIAVRIIRCCRDMGISPAVVHSQADNRSLAVMLADEAIDIGPSPASESYLVIEKILDSARKCGADAIHPGYGFLSENAAFVDACNAAGIRFIGPSSSSISLMGDKLKSRETVRAAGVPLVDGTDGPVGSIDEAVSEADRIGYPLMLKASAGGGGKGMRLVRKRTDLIDAFETTRGEAAASFNDARVFLERYVEKPRHIEVQVLGDRHGNLVHLGERECSIQRRHQKVIEECPSPAVTPKTRNRMGEAALAAARSVNYYSTGTVEFLAETRDAELNFYFLEMNTRLQVEHPVTEMVTGMDLVRAQIEVAAGNRLSVKQEDIGWSGHAIECRVYAEDPRRNFFPSPGQISTYQEPGGPGVRVDSGVYQGFEVPLEYDPMICKLVTHGSDRSEAISRMQRALTEFKVGGVETTIPFFAQVLQHPDFRSGDLHTHFIEQHRLTEPPPTEADEHLIPLLAAAVHYHLEQSHEAPSTGLSRNAWKEFGRFLQRMGGGRS